MYKNSLHVLLQSSNILLANTLYINVKSTEEVGVLRKPDIQPHYTGIIYSLLFQL